MLGKLFSVKPKRTNAARNMDRALPVCAVLSTTNVELRSPIATFPSAVKISGANVTKMVTSAILKIWKMHEVDDLRIRMHRFRLNCSFEPNFFLLRSNDTPVVTQNIVPELTVYG